jgi:hypothetical protein
MNSIIKTTTTCLLSLSFILPTKPVISDYQIQQVGPKLTLPEDLGLVGNF